MLFATDGVITKSDDYGNSDKVVSMITPRGRIYVMVKGAKSRASKLAPLSCMFTYGNFEIYEKNGAYWLKGGSVDTSFYGLSSSIEQLSLANYLCSLANEFTDEGIEDDSIMRMLLNSLHLISKGEKKREIIKGTFEFKLMCMSGYMPDISSCAYCGHDGKYNYLDVSNGRIICSDCLNKRDKEIGHISKDFEYNAYNGKLMLLDDATLHALRYIELAQSNRLFAFDIKDDEGLANFASVTESYLLEHLGHGFDALDFYNTVK